MLYNFAILMPVIIISMIVIIVIVVLLSIRSNKKRTQDLKSKAEMLGFSFNPISNIDTGQFKLLNHGYSKRISNVLKGYRDGVNLTIFDYRYTTSSGKNTHTHYQTVLMAEKKVTEFILKREHLFHKIGNIFGYKDIDFSQDKQFSKKYFLKGKDEIKLRELFDIEVLHFFDTNDIQENIEAKNDKMIFFKPNRLIQPDLLEDFIKKGIKIISMFKERY